MPKEKKELTVREMAAMGGHARAKKLTPERATEIALTAINARWDRVRRENAAKAKKAKARTKAK